ncbi:MAG: DNA cytosine methyltransferase [Myxococcota bacterium]
MDGLVGGPPCQGFSSIGKRDETDPRRKLVEHFFRLVAEVRPVFFVMENVPGLTQGSASSVLEAGLALVPDEYEITGPIILDASLYGAPTNRLRCFVIGILPAYCDLPDLQDAAKQTKPTVRDAIQDLGCAKEIGADSAGFDVFELAETALLSDYARTLRSADRRFTGNRRTVHSPKVARRFATVKPGRTDTVGRHPRLSWDGVCPTLRAGTGSDRGAYQSVRPLHPEEPRVITVREAARLQGFPDRHRFHPTIWHSFRMIGNSVPPPLAAAVLRAVARACRVESEIPVAAE